MNEKVVIIGAGSAMFTRGLVVDLIRRGWSGEVGLVDIDADALRIAERMSAKMIEAGGAGIKLAAGTDRCTILPDATAVICTIGVGGRRAWEQDVSIPRRYGIFQPVGDTVMPGGSSRALRMIPAMVDIARDVLRLCPDALFFNYGNPMSAVCRGVRKATGADMAGLCHGVFHVSNQLAGLLGVDPSLMRVSASGINHLAWFTDVRAGGENLMPRLREQARMMLGRPLTDAAPGTAFLSGEDLAAAEKECDDRVTWELFDLFGAYPAVGDRHITEFFPAMYGGEGAYFGHTLGVDSYSFESTIAYGERIFEEMRNAAMSDEPMPSDFLAKVSGEHEQVLEIIEAIREDSGNIYSANLPNVGQVPNLPQDAVVETPAIAAAGGLRPIMQPALPPGICGTLATRFQWVETIVDAALEGSRDKFVQALIIDGAVKSVDTACRLADELLAAQKQYLPQF